MVTVPSGDVASTSVYTHQFILVTEKQKQDGCKKEPSNVTCRMIPPVILSSVDFLSPLEKQTTKSHFLFPLKSVVFLALFHSSTPIQSKIKELFIFLLCLGSFPLDPPPDFRTSTGACLQYWFSSVIPSSKFN